MKFIKPLIGATAIVAAFTSMASAQSLQHRYDMLSVNDTVGDADGVLGTGADLVGGVLIPQAGNNANPNGGTGNGLSLTGAATAGITGAFTIETWATWNGGGGYQTLFSFSNGTQQEYLIHTPKRGNDNIQSSSFHVGPNEYRAETASPGTSLTQFVTTYDGNNTASVYINGVLAITINTVPDSFNLSSFTQNGIAGSSPWPDDTFFGTVSDFRIYEGALTAGQVSTLNGLGADASNGAITAAIPEPSTIALLVGAGVAGLVIRRRSRA